MPDQPDLPIDDDPPAELDPMGVAQGQPDGPAIARLARAELRVADEDR